MRLVECVPNFSEGRDRGVIDAIAQAIAGAGGVKLLDVDAGADTNRTVYTFVGEPGAVSDALLAAARVAAGLIDMSRHRGAHPRMGALDVCPIVPVSGVTMEECVEVSRELGRRLAEALDIPVYFYEHAATRPGRRSLAAIRAGEYEGLAAKLADPDWSPDCGPARLNPRLGATVVGARAFLIAYNVNLNTRDRKLAHDIALTIREAGRAKRDAANEIVRDASGDAVQVPGRLKAVRAIGWYIEQYQQAQVSINLLDYRTTPLHVVFDTVREEAERRGLVVTGSELVGVTPLEPMVEAGRHYLRRQGRSMGAPERDLVALAVQTLGLSQLGPFDPDKRVIEYAVRAAAPLASLTLDRFVDEVSRDSLAPGGGSVSALAGGLASALAAMVANLTVGRRGHEAAWARCSEIADRAQSVKDALVGAIDEDAQAFEQVVAANRLPKATPEQQQSRASALAAAYARATEVPLATATRCLEALHLAREVATLGIDTASSDAGVAALLARAGVQGAALNVRINLPSLADEDMRAAYRREVDRLESEAAVAAEQALHTVRAAIDPAVPPSAGRASTQAPS